MSLVHFPPNVAEGPPRTVAPSQFKKQFTLVALVAFSGDVVVAIVFLLLQPFEALINYVLAASLLASGSVLLYLFSVVFPKRYKANYEMKYGSSLE